MSEKEMDSDLQFDTKCFFRVCLQLASGKVQEKNRGLIFGTVKVRGENQITIFVRIAS